MPKSKQRKNRKPAGGSSGGGGLMSMRSGFKSFMGGSSKGKPSPLARVVDAAIWVAVLALVVVMAYRRFR